MSVNIKKGLLNYFQLIVPYCIFIFIVCEHHVEFTAIKNISLYSSLLFCFIILFIDKEDIWKNIKINFSVAKFPLIFLIIFVLYSIMVSFFPYSNDFNAFDTTFSEFGRGVSFLFVVLIYANSNKKNYQMFFYSILTAFVCITLYYIKPLFTEINNLNSSNIETARLVSRAYSFYPDRFFIFGLLAVLFFKNMYIKIIFIVLIVVSLIMGLLTGARGLWVALIISFLLFLAFIIPILKNKKIDYKKILVISIVVISSIVYIVQNSYIVQYKASQNNSSGRDLILKERLPLFLNSNRAFWGLGYNEHLYDKFLSDQVDKGHKISMMQIRDNKRHWFNDEPFFIGNYYYFGVGVFALLLSFLSILWYCLKEYLKTKNIFFAGIFISTFAYFGIRGLVETYNLKILYLFYMIGFFILLKRYYLEEKIK